MMTEVHQSSVYLDANVFIDFVEGHDVLAHHLKRLFERMSGRRGIFVTSEITIAEVMAPSREFGPRSPELKHHYRQILFSTPTILLYPVDRSILMRTVEMREASGHRLPDAIHCATAAETGCRYLISRDRRMNRLPEGITYIDASAERIAFLIESLRD